MSPQQGDHGTPVAIVTPAERVPGLYNVQVTTGEAFFDLTIGQVKSLVYGRGWQLVPPKEGGRA